MRLSDLTRNLGLTQAAGDVDTEILTIGFDSRFAGPGQLFVAVRGTVSDGHRFIGMAVERGSAAIVCETLPDTLHPGTAYLVASDSSEALGLIASRFYGNPSEQLILVGVTGTNGKTTTATLLYRLFMELGFGAGLISTIINKVNDTDIAATHTTPDPVKLNEMLAMMVSHGCQYCFMEVSSHSVDQRRIAGLRFAGGIFTNLTHDHLDYHKTFPAYLAAKKRFFDDLPREAFALSNKDDRNGQVMLQNTAARKFTFSLQRPADFHCRIMENSFSGLMLNIGGIETWFRMVGKFNASNLLAVYATAILLGQENLRVLEVLTSLEPVSGRFNLRTGNQGVFAIVDYAHTPDALKNVLETINEIRGHNEKLITVTGAGGNRDKSKRPLMAQIAAMASDHVILTSDNPRDEEPSAILADMMTGIDKSLEKKTMVVENRREAIKAACNMAAPGDIILVAGKGHETYQEIRGVRHHFDDFEVVGEFLGSETNVTT